jgi:hypothetical protein
MTRQYVAFGIQDIDNQMFQNIESGYNLKPENGLFAYDFIRDDKTISPYESWCEKEKCDRGSLREGVIFTIQTGAKVYKIDSWGDLHNLIKKCPLVKTIDGLDNKKVVDIGVDFKKAATKYDVISFTYKGNANTLLSENHEVNVISEKLLKGIERTYEVDGNIKLNTSSWEIPCIVVFNPNVIENVKKFKNPNIHHLDENEIFDEIVKEFKRGTKEEDIIKILSKYCNDDVNINEIIDKVKKTEQIEKKHNDLVDRLEGLITVQLTGDINLEDEIDATVKKIYDLSLKPNNETFEDFNKYVCTALRSGIMGIEYSEGKAQDTEEAMLDAFGDFFMDDND